MTPPLKRRRFLKIIAAEVALASLGSRCLFGREGAPSLERHDWSGIALGSEASLQIHLSDSSKAKKLTTLCVGELQRLEAIFSLYDARSELSRLNQHGRLEKPAPELVELLELSLSIHEKTMGAFDISIHPIIELYRNAFAVTQGPPTRLELENAIRLVDLSQLEISSSRIAYGRKGMRLTLNGIAQGYITDKITELLHNEGVEHTLVDCGEKRALGAHPEGRPWAIGILDGTNPNALYTLAEIENQALATSGGYGTRFDESGAFHHLINPRTGKSVSNYSSVSVIAAQAATADALSTAIATSRPEQVDSILARFPQARAILQTTDPA